MFCGYLHAGPATVANTAVQWPADMAVKGTVVTFTFTSKVGTAPPFARPTPPLVLFLSLSPHQTLADAPIGCNLVRCGQDQFGNDVQCSSMTLGQFTVTMAYSSYQATVILDCLLGTFTVRAVPPVGGVYTITLGVNGSPMYRTYCVIEGRLPRCPYEMGLLGA